MHSGHAAVLIFLIFGGLFVCGLGKCPVRQLLTGPRGQISYKSWPVVDKCGWTLPLQPQEDFALILSLRRIQMQYASGDHKLCSGYLEVPEAKTFCHKPAGACFIYGIKSKCDTQKILSIMNEAGCRETALFMVSKIGRRINLLPTKSVTKSFAIDYNYVKCSNDAKKETSRANRPSPPPTTARATTTTNVTILPSSCDTGKILLKGRSHIEKHESSESADTGSGLIATIAILVVLLMLSMLVILWIHRRNRKLEERYELQSRIRYSLSNPVRDRASVMAANGQAQGSGYNETSNHATPLHGEVIQDSAGGYSEIVARDQPMEQNASNGNTSNEILYSNMPTPNPPPQDCVYAVVNKSTRRK